MPNSSVILVFIFYVLWIQLTARIQSWKETIYNRGLSEIAGLYSLISKTYYRRHPHGVDFPAPHWTRHTNRYSHASLEDYVRARIFLAPTKNRHFLDYKRYVCDAGEYVSNNPTASLLS